MLKRCGKALKAKIRGWNDSLRRPFLSSARTPKVLGLDESLLLQVVRINVNRNDRALYNLLHCFRFLRHFSQAAGQDLNGQTILEMGSSREPGLALACLFAGCRKYLANNIFALDRWLPRAYVELMLMIMSGLLPIDPDRSGEIVSWERDKTGRDIAVLREDRLQLVAPVGAEAIDLPDACADIVHSNSMLEHVVHPREVIKNIFRLLRPGGYSYHAIDLRDHTDFQRPLDFLRFSHHEYIARNGWRENRLRASDFLELFANAGFEIVSTALMDYEPTLAAGGNTDVSDMVLKPLDAIYPQKSLEHVTAWVTREKRESFDPAFREKSLEDLSVLGMHVTLRKPE